MLKNSREILEGAGIGLFAGLIIGISDHDWIRFAIALGLIAYSGGFRKNPLASSTTHLRHSLTGISAFLAVLAGLTLNRQQTFDRSPRDVVNALTKAGYSPSEAREFYFKQVMVEISEQDPASPSPESIIRAYSHNGMNDSLPEPTDTLKEP